MTKDLVVRESSEVAEVSMTDLMPAGGGRLQPGDVGMPPRLRISQPNRPVEINDAEVKPGLWVNTLTGETFEGLDIFVLVYLDDTRVMWPEAFDAGNDPVCASDNGKMPAESSDMRVLTDPKPGPCSTCQFGQFSEDGTPPRCKRQRNFLVLMLEQEEPAIITMQSTALKAARHLTTLAQTTQAGGKSIYLTAQKIKDDRGGWFVPAVTKGQKLDRSTLPQLLEAKRELQNLVITADVETREEVYDAAADTEDILPDDIPF